MALQVWLPLNGNLNNNGISNPTVVNNGATVVTTGKIGSCYSFDGSDDFISIDDTDLYRIFSGGSQQFTIACWVYHADSSRAILFGDFGLSGGINFNMELSAGHYVRFYWAAAPDKIFSEASVDASAWTHIAITYDGTDVKFYKNGVYISSQAGPLSAKNKTSGVFYLGRDSRTGSTALNGRLNDFRIYDHALSPREVAEIAKGLVAHYPLNDWNNASNLVYNGFGEHGSDGWTPIVTVETTDLPSADTTIKASFTRGVTTDYIPINPNNIYAVSCYLKALSGATGNTYPSIEPYDIDKKFIQTHNCADGFNNTWKTTLSQPLNTGDTVIHATDISNWSTANNNYYYHVSIFGYKDSTGRLYPDMEYTQDSPTFGTYSDKSNLNKTNNTITLKAPYIGAPRPAGTVICQSTEGSTYFYPFGRVQVSTIADWTQKSATINFNMHRLRYARYIKWQNYSGAKYAGIKITDTTWGSNVVYDTSGFGNNGTTNGTLTVSSNTARYDVSTAFNGVDNCIKVPFNTMIGTELTDYSISVWFYKKSIGTKNYQTIFGGPSGYELEARVSSGSDPLIKLYNWGGGQYAYQFNVWNHLVFVQTTTEVKCYLNGELVISGGTPKANPSGNYFLGSWRDTTSQNFEGQMSDFRIYATALTADQVKQLYEAPISLANNGTLFANEFNET